MADLREKIKAISSTKGASAPESAKRIGMGCLLVAVLAVSILTFFLAVGLFISGNWIIALFPLVLFSLSAVIVAVLIFPKEFDSL